MKTLKELLDHISTKYKEWLSGRIPGEPESCKEFVSCLKCKWIHGKYDLSFSGYNCAWPENIYYEHEPPTGCYPKYHQTANEINHDGKCKWWDRSWHEYFKQLKRKDAKQNENL